jgi:hypothetical protein
MPAEKRLILCLLLPRWQQNTNGRVFEAVLNKELLVLDFIFLIKYLESWQ